MLKSENARLSGWVYVDIRGRDLSSVVRDMQRAVAPNVKLPAGYSVSWSGQFEYLERATAKLKIVIRDLVHHFCIVVPDVQSHGRSRSDHGDMPFALAVVSGYWAAQA